MHMQSGYVSVRDVADVELRAGDVLLLEADQSFKKRFESNPAFGLVGVGCESRHSALHCIGRDTVCPCPACRTEGMKS